MVFQGVKHKWVVRSFHLLNVIALGVALVILANTSANAHDLSFLQKQWAALQTQWESLRQKRDSMPADIIQGHVDALIAQKQLIEASEPPETDHQLLHEAWAGEMKSRKFDSFVAEREAALKATKAN